VIDRDMEIIGGTSVEVLVLDSVVPVDETVERLDVVIGGRVESGLPGVEVSTGACELVEADVGSEQHTEVGSMSEAELVSVKESDDRLSSTCGRGAGDAIAPGMEHIKKRIAKNKFEKGIVAAQSCPEFVKESLIQTVHASRTNLNGDCADIKDIRCTSERTDVGVALLVVLQVEAEGRAMLSCPCIVEEEVAVGSEQTTQISEEVNKGRPTALGKFPLPKFLQ
jgi:hypothetical protein